MAKNQRQHSAWRKNPALTHIYLSPHLDDAALSCGGLLYQQTQAGARVIVLTLCAGAPPPGAALSAFAQSLHARWQLSAAQGVRRRRAEDRAALRWLGAEGIYFDLPDCIYRVDPATGAALYASDAALFGPLSPREAALVPQAAQRLTALLEKFPARRLYAPLALGQHVDHQLARQIAELLPDGVAAYYEDYPYADRAANLSPHSRVTGAETVGLVAELQPLTEAALWAKGRALAAYTSQISSFWEDQTALETSLRRFALQVGGGELAERLWRAP